MKKSIILSGLSIVTALILTGCNSSSDDTTSNNQTSDTLQGRFIDAAVANIEYSCESGIEGKTDANGSFKYLQGDKVTFHIGKLKLGETKPLANNQVVTPKDLTDNNKTLTLMLQVLQSLDKDNNTSNGITIPEDIVESLSSLEDNVDIKELNSSKILTLDTKLKEKIDKDGDNKIDITEQKAHNHFKSSLDALKHNKNGKSQNNEKNNNEKGQKGQGQNKSGNQQEHGNKESNNTGTVVDVFSYEKYDLTQELKDAIAYMGNEERLAYDLYKNLYETHSANGDEIKQLINIADKSEVRHIQTVRDIVKKYEINATELTKLDKDVVGNGSTDIDSVRGKYGIQKIQDLYDALFDKGVTSKQSALEVGCMVEVTDVNDLNEYIKMAQDANVKDIEDAFVALRKGSYNHYWAFDKGLKNMGIENGCCSLGTIDGVNYCQPDYPKHEE